MCKLQGRIVAIRVPTLQRGRISSGLPGRYGRVPNYRRALSSQISRLVAFSRKGHGSNLFRSVTLASWENSGYVDASDDVVIFGAGPTGLSALVVAKTANAHVITIDPLKFQHEIARKFDADETIDPTHGDLKDKIMGLTGWRGSSLVVEASGKDKAIASIFDIAGNGVRVRLIGHSIARKVPVEIGWTIWKTLVITGSVEREILPSGEQLPAKQVSFIASS